MSEIMTDKMMDRLREWRTAIEFSKPLNWNCEDMVLYHAMRSIIKEQGEKRVSRTVLYRIADYFQLPEEKRSWQRLIDMLRKAGVEVSDHE